MKYLKLPSSINSGAKAHQCINPAKGVTAAIGMEPLGSAAGFNCADIHSVGLEYTWGKVIISMIQ